ncbi:hypothetical protein ACS0TY_001809 [Phlomoides rotata]
MFYFVLLTSLSNLLQLENLLANDAKEVEIQGVIAEVPAVILRCISRDEAALAVAQKAFKGLYENASNNAHVDAHLVILVAISDVSKLVVKELTSWVSLLFADWYNICETSYHFSLDYGEELSVSNCVSSEEMKPQSHQGRQISFLAIEDQGSSKLSLLPKILPVTVYSKRCWRKREHPLIPGKDLCFLDPVFDGANFQVHFLYKGALRVLLVLVLLHDFPELLCDYHFSFCDVIPPSCIRMQNIILSALPRNIRLPDPSTRNLKSISKNPFLRLMQLLKQSRSRVMSMSISSSDVTICDSDKAAGIPIPH